MSPLEHEVSTPTPVALNTLSTALAELKAVGADQFAPLRFAHLVALVRRVDSVSAAVASAIADKVHRLLADYRHDYQQARCSAEGLLGQACAAHPNAATALTQRFDAGDFTGLGRLHRRLAQQAHTTPLAALTAQLRENAERLKEDASEPTFDELLQQQELDILQAFAGADSSEMAALAPISAHETELNAVRGYRASWLKRHFDKRVTQAIKNAPEDPGPLNPHMLMIRSLTAMRDLSPDYLYRYLAYLDTLLWLEQAGDALEPGKPTKAPSSEVNASRPGRRGGRTK